MDKIRYEKRGKVLANCPIGMTGEVRIPEGVERISSFAFSASRVESVIMPKSLKVIGHNAFANCRRLRKVILNDGLQDIGISAFQECSSLTSISIPESISHIRTMSFYGCPLESVIFHEGIKSIGRGAFRIAEGIITLPESLTLIETDNFTIIIAKEVTAFKRVEELAFLYKKN